MQHPHIQAEVFAICLGGGQYTGVNDVSPNSRPPRTCEWNLSHVKVRPPWLALNPAHLCPYKEGETEPSPAGTGRGHSALQSEEATSFQKEPSRP